MDARAISGPTIILRSGNYFDLQDPSASRFEVSDIAHALSNICRFTGHTQRFYSVAEHSVICSHMVPPEDAIRRALAVEQRVCMGNGDDWGYGEPTDDDCALIRFLSPEDARAAFFARYHYIRCAS